jgi:predicted oxidoreductase
MTSITIPAVSLNNGTTIPQLGYGTLALQPDRSTTPQNTEIAAKTVSEALAAGYRHIDTAQAYGTESGVGKAIADSGLDRDQIYITSKLANANHAPDDVKRSIEQTLTHLGVDQIDLFLVHWPLPTLYNGDYVLTWKAVAGLVTDGLARSAGVSNFQPARLERIIADTGLTPAVNQIELHPYFANTARARSGDRIWNRRRGPQPARTQQRRTRRRHTPPDRRQPPQISRTNHPPLAHATRSHRNPQIRPARADGRKPRHLRLRTQP